MANILLFTKGTDGDLVPFLEIGSLLKRRGRRVTLLSHCHYSGIAERMGLDFATLDTEDEFERFIQDGHLLNKPQGIPLFFRKHYLPKIISEYEMIQNRCRSRDTVLVCRHAATPADLLITEKLGIPVVRLFTAASQVDTLQMVEKLYEEMFADDINNVRVKLGLSPQTNWYDWLRLPRMNIGNWPDWFAEPNLLPGLRAVGFIRSDSAETGVVPERADRILDKGRHTILITSGTGVFLGAQFYSAAAEGCRLLAERMPGCEALLVTRHSELLPNKLPKNVSWFASLPFASIIHRISAIVHHGGTGTLSRALAAGVPQLVLPFGADRPDNARRLERLGVAEVLPPTNRHPENIACALQRLINSSEIQRKCHLWAEMMHSADEAATACDVIEACAN